jgi:MFS family permease
LPTAASRLPVDRTLRTAKWAVTAAFMGSGFGFANWAARIPQVRDALHVNPSTLGLILLSIAVGSLIAMPLAGIVVTKIGATRAVATMSVIFAIGLVVVAIGYRFGIAPVVAGLFLVGFGNGTWDVAMNVEGAAVERNLRRAIMPKFHAGWSIGTVAGALLGAAMVALGVSVTVHLIGTAVILAVGVPLATRKFLNREVEKESADEPSQPTRKRNPLAAWLEPRTLLIGVFVMTMAFTEGTGNDWLAISVIDGYKAAPVLGPLTLAIFLASMTTGRWFGPSFIDRYGRVVVLRFTAAVALVGLLLIVFGQVLPVAMVGAVLLGLGASLGFPVGMSAAADDPAFAAARVSVVASIGYTAFLAGPPLIGFLGNHAGVLHALTVTAGLLVLAILLAGFTRPLPGSDADTATPATKTESAARD